MSVAEEKKIIIKLPSLHWRMFLSIRFLIVLSALLCCSAFAYWFQNIHPFLSIHSARVETFSTILSSDMTGRIVQMGPKEGDSVKKGETLFILDNDLIIAKQIELKQTLDSLNSQIENEKRRAGKALEEYLIASNGLEDVEIVNKHLTLMEEAQEKSESASSKIASTKAELEHLNAQLKKSSFTAPFNGIILKKGKNIGASVSLGEPIYILSDPDQLWIEAEIPEHHLSKISLGTPAEVRVFAYPKSKFTGKVTYIGPATVAKSSFLPITGKDEMIPIKISLDYPKISLKSGLSASVRLKVR